MNEWSPMTRLKRKKLWKSQSWRQAARGAQFGAQSREPLVSEPSKKDIRRILTRKSTQAAVDTLARMAIESRSTFRILGELAAKGDDEVRVRATMAILGLADACGDIPGLMAHLLIAALDKDAEERGQGRPGTLAPLMLLGVPILGRALAHGEPEDRVAAAKAIGIAASHGHNMVMVSPALTSGISDEDVRVQRESIGALGKMEAAGQDMRFVLPLLLMASTQEENPIREEVLELLGRPGMSEKMPEMLRDFSEVSMIGIEDHRSRVQAATVVNAIMVSEPLLEGVRAQKPGYREARDALQGVLDEITRLEQGDGTMRS